MSPQPVEITPIPLVRSEMTELPGRRDCGVTQPPADAVPGIAGKRSLKTLQHLHANSKEVDPGEGTYERSSERSSVDEQLRRRAQFIINEQRAERLQGDRMGTSFIGEQIEQQYVQKPGDHSARAASPSGLPAGRIAPGGRVEAGKGAAQQLQARTDAVRRPDHPVRAAAAHRAHWEGVEGDVPVARPHRDQPGGILWPNFQEGKFRSTMPFG